MGFGHACAAELLVPSGFICVQDRYAGGRNLDLRSLAAPAWGNVVLVGGGNRDHFRILRRIRYFVGAGILKKRERGFST